MICPSCQINQVIDERSFGALFTCKNCQAVYFINFDGQPEYSDIPPVLHQQEEASDPFSQNLGLESISEPNNFLNNNSDNINDNNTSENHSGYGLDSIGSDNDSEISFNPDFQPFTPFESTQSINTIAEPTSADSQINNYNSSFASAANEITEYGNTESQIAQLNYSLKIMGLDTIEIKKLLKEAIDDSRFGWDVGEVMKNIKNGEIKFEELNPVKAFILAKRLHFLDVEKIWTQNAVG